MFQISLCFQLTSAFPNYRPWPPWQWRFPSLASLQLLSYNSRMEFGRSGKHTNSSTPGSVHGAEIHNRERHRSASAIPRVHNMRNWGCSRGASAGRINVSARSAAGHGLASRHLHWTHLCVWGGEPPPPLTHREGRVGSFVGGHRQRSGERLASARVSLEAVRTQRGHDLTKVGVDIKATPNNSNAGGWRSHRAHRTHASG